MTVSNHVWIQGESILVNAEFRFKDFVKKVTGYKWVSGPTWQFPKESKAAWELWTKLPFQKFTFADEVIELKSQYESTELVALEKASEAKVSNNLPDVPGEKGFKSWNHQKQAFHFAANLSSAMLSMEMGTGKTKVACNLLRESKAKSVLIICPRAVIPVWPSELHKHYGGLFAYEKLNKGTKANVKKLGSILPRIEQISGLTAIINYESAWRDEVGKMLASHQWDYVILDESHKIKAPDSNVSKWVHKLKAKKRLCLTGTPIGNSPEDIWSQFRFLDSSIFGDSFWRFRVTYGQQGKFRDWQYTGKSINTIKEKMHPIMFYAGKDLLDLPEYVDLERTYEYSPKLAKIYDDFSRTLVAAIENAKGDKEMLSVELAVTSILKLQQISSGFVRTEKESPVTEIDISTKLECLDEILEEISDNIPDDPIVIFYRFKHEAKILREHLESNHQSTVSELSGSKNTLKEWQDGETRFILVQIQSGSAGIDLTRACRCIYYSMDFSLTNYEQSRARIHRPGQTRTAYYYTIIGRLPNNGTTIDDSIYHCLKGKLNLLDYLIKPEVS